ncbi:MAG: hypothetical protein DI563_21950 [Variovorax paradoxus]|uniref:Radical SAM protein n=1 Tax=Variovorax paradoxus TaxID=34073 RepID=A0A2W5R9I6_VARPD|nr:MAG: hypothetical protein DI563_21950 [Variovorax paradoxus]
MDAPVSFHPPVPTSDEAALLDALRARAPRIVHRAPDADDDTRWHPLRIGGRDWRLARPITFTPYASTRPCSARCAFCSENLRTERGSVPAARLRPDAGYFAELGRALAALRGVPLSWSLSGLENTDDPAWLLRLLDTLRAAERDGVAIEERVLYSNGAGFAHAQGAVLRDALLQFRLSWIELSRHHHDGATNQALMRFRAGEPIAGQAVFERVLAGLADTFPVRLVCLLQRGGVRTPQDVAAYLGWARAHGAGTVILREFSELDVGYRDNATARYLGAARVPMAALLQACLADPATSTGWEIESLTEGYYFWNLRLRTRGGLQVVFERSDYAAMHRRHASGDVYKLVYFANGQLCAGWEPGHDVLLDTRAAEPAHG